MAIEFTCPHCQHPYKLKDEFAGKRATCKNPDCREQITIPSPPTAAELEAAALSALSDEIPGPGTQVAAEKVIPMTCDFCTHKWNEPWAKGGKNTLCPNPECRQRLRVPEPKKDVPDDWRQQKSRLPSLAKQAHEKLEGVADAGDARIVSGKALEDAGATGIEYEPRPLKQKIFFAMTAIGLVGGLVFGIWFMVQRSKSRGDEQLMADAQAKFADAVKELPPTEVGLCTALMHAAAAEYALKQNTAEKLREAHELFAKARVDIRNAPLNVARHAVAAEIALSTLTLGGTEEQVQNEIRFRWVPDTDSRLLRATERPRTIHEELRQTLSPLLSADYDFRIALARRLTRTLTQKEQAAFAADILPLALFNDAEKNEARAVIALEIHRTGKGGDVPLRIAEELKTHFAGGITGTPYPATAQTLFTVLAVEKAPLVVQPPPPAGNIQDGSRLAFTAKYLLENNPGEALKLASRPGQPEGQLRALVLCAEWSSDPGAAIDTALEIINGMRGKQNVTLSQSQILRLSQLASVAGRHEQAKALAEALTDEGLRTWAKGDAIHLRSEKNPTEKADEAWVEMPLTPDKMKAGHAWGRFWVARQNARISGDRDAEKKIVAMWSPDMIHAFGLAGIALGLQER
jgi:hypothetical protein